MAATHHHHHQQQPQPPPPPQSRGPPLPLPPLTSTFHKNASRVVSPYTTTVPMPMPWPPTPPTATTIAHNDNHHHHHLTGGTAKPVPVRHGNNGHPRTPHGHGHGGEMRHSQPAARYSSHHHHNPHHHPHHHGHPEAMTPSHDNGQYRRHAPTHPPPPSWSGPVRDTRHFASPHHQHQQHHHHPHPQQHPHHDHDYSYVQPSPRNTINNNNNNNNNNNKGSGNNYSNQPPPPMHHHSSYPPHAHHAPHAHHGHQNHIQQKTYHSPPHASPPARHHHQPPGEQPNPPTHPNQQQPSQPPTPHHHRQHHQQQQPTHQHCHQQHQQQNHASSRNANDNNSNNNANANASSSPALEKMEEELRAFAAPSAAASRMYKRSQSLPVEIGGIGSNTGAATMNGATNIMNGATSANNANGAATNTNNATNNASTKNGKVGMPIPARRASEPLPNDGPRATRGVTNVFASAVDNIIAAAEAIAQRDGSPSPTPIAAKNNVTGTNAIHHANTANHQSFMNPPPLQDSSSSPSCSRSLVYPNSHPGTSPSNIHSSSSVAHANSPPSNYANYSTTPHATTSYDPQPSQPSSAPYGTIRSSSRNNMHDYSNGHYHHHCNATYSRNTNNKRPLHPSSSSTTTSTTPSNVHDDNRYSHPPPKKAKRTAKPKTPKTEKNTAPPPSHEKDSPNNTHNNSSTTNEAEEIQQAIKAATEIQSDPSFYRAILLHMALERESKESPKKPSAAVAANLGARRDWSNDKGNGGGHVANGSGVGGGLEDEPPSNVIYEGFFWKDYPQLENILRRFMEEYYEMSENRPQSKKQQQFNNRLVSIIHCTATSNGWTFDPQTYGGSDKKFNSPKSLPGSSNEFNYKKLRDRIRCYYKTHVQNSKKRLITLLKNPTKLKNREVLLRLVKEVGSEDGGGKERVVAETLEDYDCKMDYSRGSSAVATTPAAISAVITPSSTFASNEDYSIQASLSSSSFTSTCTYSTSPTGASTISSPLRKEASPTTNSNIQTSTLSNHAPTASPFKQLEHAAILQSMRAREI